jgi:hypothetical protein
MQEIAYGQFQGLGEAERFISPLFWASLAK